jgi:hypothetical protein
MPANRNTISYREDRNSRNFEASLTDISMESLGGVFGELFAQRGAARTITTGARPLRGEDIAIEHQNQKELPAATSANGSEAHSTQAVNEIEKVVEEPSAEKQRILKIFNLDGESLELADNRLKATSAAEYYKRLTYLFIYAQEILLGRSSTPKSEVVTVLKAAKVFDPNCSFWLKQKKGFTVDADDRMKLIAGAREHAVKTITEALDSNVPDTWNPDTKTMKPRVGKKKKA